MTTPTDPPPVTTAPSPTPQQTTISVDQGPYPTQGPPDTNAPTGDPVHR
ncbi:hypothetical protein [Kitasatospora sp. McL0602]